MANLQLGEQRLAHIKKIAIAGSCGKTTVKKLLGAILEVANHDVLMVTGVLGDEQALLKALADLTCAHELALFELGVAQKGQGTPLTNVMVPDVSLVTCVGQASLGSFDSTEALADAMTEIYTALSRSGCAVVNYDEPFAPKWLLNLHNSATLTYSIYNTKPADVLLSQAQYLPGKGSRMSIKTPRGQIEVRTHLLGEHNWSNVLAAVSVANCLNISLDAIVEGIAQVHPDMGCLQLRDICVDNWQMIDDTAHANPTSVRAAIDVLATCRGWRVLVLGDMSDLGEHAPQLHHAVGQYARERFINDVVALGPMAQETCAGFGGGQAFQSHDDVLAFLNTLKTQKCTVLVKGSRGAAMEKVVQAFANRQA